MSCPFTALQMEKYSPITVVHGIGLKCEQTSHIHAGRHPVTLYYCQYPAIISDIILSTHLSISGREKFSLVLIFFLQEIILHSAHRVCRRIKKQLQPRSHIYCILSFCFLHARALSTSTPFLWIIWEFFTSFMGFSIQFLDSLRVHAFPSGKLISDTL